MAMVCHMEKYKASDCGGVGIEDDRASEQVNEKNPNLDKSRTNENIHRVLNNRALGTYTNTKWSHVAKVFGAKKRAINEMRKANGKKKLRKDAVTCCSFIVSEDHSFFEGMDRQTQIKFFETAVEWFNKEFGNNVLQYSIHFDEYTPHMHMRLCPQIEDNLNAKEMFNRTALRKIQKELPKYFQEHGFDVGEPVHDSLAVHKDEAEQRLFALQTKEEKLETALEQKKREYQELTQEIKDWRDVRLDCQMKVDSLREEMTSLEGQIRANQAKINEQTQVLNYTNRAVETAQETLKQNQTDVSKLEDILRELLAQIKTAEKRYDDTLKQCEVLEVGLQSCKDVKQYYDWIMDLISLDPSLKRYIDEKRSGLIHIQDAIEKTKEQVKIANAERKSNITLGDLVRKPTAPKGGGDAR